MSSKSYILFGVGVVLMLLVSLQQELSMVSDRLKQNNQSVASEYDEDPSKQEGQPLSTVWAEAEEALLFDEAGDANAELLAKYNLTLEDVIGSSPTSKLPVITSIIPSTNSARTLESLWGESKNASLVKREKITTGIHVIMSFYKGSYKKDRFEEILVALRKNLRNPFIMAVHTLWEDYDPIEFVGDPELELKLVRVNFGVQPTYKDLLDYANLRMGRGAIAAVINSDIFFDETIGCVSPVTDQHTAFNARKQHLVYALSRHPTYPCLNRPDFCENYSGSHDAFVFALPLPYNFSSAVDFTQNNLGAENILIWEFRQTEGYVVKNPCNTIRCYHIHCTKERHYEHKTISRGRNRIGPIDRHASVMPTKVKCGHVLY